MVYFRNNWGGGEQYLGGELHEEVWERGSLEDEIADEGARGRESVGKKEMRERRKGSAVESM
jgi:hypothetical protein